MVFKLEPLYKPGMKREISDGLVQDTKDRYDDIHEDFVDEIFGVQTILTEK